MFLGMNILDKSVMGIEFQYNSSNRYEITVGSCGNDLAINRQIIINPNVFVEFNTNNSI